MLQNILKRRKREGRSNLSIVIGKEIVFLNRYFLSPMGRCLCLLCCILVTFILAVGITAALLAVLMKSYPRKSSGYLSQSFRRNFIDQSKGELNTFFSF